MDALVWCLACGTWFCGVGEPHKEQWFEKVADLTKREAAKEKREHNLLKRSIKIQKRSGMAEQTDEANIVERTYAHSTRLDGGCMPTAKS